jgi:cell wall-associated NlpC family hydrolase
MERRVLSSIILIATLVAAGCASSPRRSDDVVIPEVIEQGQETPGTRVARTAVEYVGIPYKYGGDSPRTGFDCSGLVFYSHQRVGLDVPRTAAQQSVAAKPVTTALRPGDLVFFRINSREVDHVGIYLGGGRFLHAPREGRVVSAAYLDDPYYRARFSGAGRFW